MRNYRFLALFLSLIISMLAMTGCVSRGEYKDNSSEEMSSDSPESAPTEEKEEELPVDSSMPDMPIEEESDDEEKAPPEEEKKELPPPNLEEISKLSAANIPWGPGVHKNSDGRPIACVDLQEKYGKYDAHFIAPMEKKIYLTFDEGWENGNSAKILDVLKEKEVSAVFFVTLEYVKGNPDLIRRMIDEGHIVGNHSAGHPNYVNVSLEEAMEATNKLHQYMLDEYDYEMTLFRYPEGAFNEQAAALLQAMGYKQVFWSFAYADWDVNKQMDAATAFEKITSNTHEGAIYLLHAVSATNSDILGDVIDYWRDNGYEICEYDVSYGE